MDDGNQILIPASFSALYVPPGKLKPSLGAREMAARYELCEDMAQLLTEQAANQQFQLGIGGTPQGAGHGLAALARRRPLAIQRLCGG